MKTLSLQLCKKLADMGIETESSLYWCPDYGDTTDNKASAVLNGKMCAQHFPAYTLDELPAVLRTIGRRKKWGYECNCGCGLESPVILTADSEEYKSRKIPYPYTIDVVEAHFVNVCRGYFLEGTIGEGSQAEKYIYNLLEGIERMDVATKYVEGENLVCALCMKKHTGDEIRHNSRNLLIN